MCVVRDWIAPMLLDKGANVMYLELKDIVKIRSARYSFAAVKKDGSTLVWGRRGASFKERTLERESCRLWW